MCYWKGEGSGEKGLIRCFQLLLTDKILRNCLFWGDNWKRGGSKAGERYLTVAPRCVGAQVAGGTS